MPHTGVFNDSSKKSSHPQLDDFDHESYVVQDPEDPNERSIVPEELRPSQQPAPSSSRLRPLPSCSQRRTLDDEDDEEEEQLTSTPREPASKRPRFNDPFSSDPTPLALRRTRRKNLNKL